MRILSALFLLLLAVPPAPGRAAAEPDRAARLDAWLDPFAASGHLSGCLLVAEGDSILYERCFGRADAAWDLPNDPATRFAVASVTKPLQNILVARLVDAGALDLADTLSHWLPDFPRGDEILVVQLLNHTAAVPHRVTTAAEESRFYTPADMVEKVVEQGLLSDPGVVRNYSSAGYSVMARICELAGGAPWSALMERHVFTPAAMARTVHPDPGAVIPRMATSYRWTAAGLRALPPKHLSFLVGAGSLYSTPRDLFRCIRTLVDGGYGETAQSYVLRDGGVSWNGVTYGYRAFADHDAATGRTVIVCANVVTGALDRIREAVPRILAGEEPAPPEIPRVTAVELPPENLEELEGIYQLRPGSELDVRAEDGLLHANDWILTPVGGDRFFSIQDYGFAAFVRDSTGAVVRIDWGEEPWAMPRLGDR